MDYLVTLLDHGWFGSTLGVISLCFAVFFYLVPRQQSALTAHLSSLRLIGFGDDKLPSRTSVLYDGIEVPRISKTRLAIWNSGRTTISGSQVVRDDPLRCQFGSGSAILETQVLRVTREVISLSIEHSKNSNVLVISFDFFDRHDGAVIDIYHTSESLYPLVLGTTQGIPRGVRVRRLSYVEASKASFWANVVFTATLCLGGFVLISDAVYGKGKVSFGGHPSNAVTLIVGLLYVSLPLAANIFFASRRYPKSLRSDS